MIPTGIRFVDERGFLTREAIALLDRLDVGQPQQIVPTVGLGMSPASVLDLPPGAAATISAAIASNTSGGAVAVSIWVVPAGGVVQPGYLVASGTVPANGSLSLPLAGVVIPPGGGLYAQAGLGGVVTLTVSGTRRAA